MSGRRVYDVAKEMGVPSKDLIQRLREMGVDVKSHSSTIDDAVVEQLKGGAQAPAADAAAPKAPPAKPKPEPSDVVRPEQQRRTAPTRPPARADAPTRPTAGPVEPPAPAPAPEPEPEKPAAPAGIMVHRGVTIKEFAEKAGVAPTEVIKVLMRQGSMKTITQSMSDEEILVVGDELGVRVDVVDPEVEEQIVEVTEQAVVEAEQELEPRPPVVTVMGHVDHGKTTVLDSIRSTDVAAREHGGITQHIGAYQVDRDGSRITFIDTPGHEAFTAMRARGAQATDIAVLVVAADDGVMPQTVEAIDHARAAGVPIIVAVNKIDKPEADPTRVRTQLAERGLQPQEWGGDTLFVDVSAKAGTNLEDLLVGISLVAEELDLKAVASGPGRGIVLEAHLDKGRGPLATVLVESGVINVGDAIVAGNAWGKVRAMLDEWGEPVKQAEPARPVLILGWDAVPQVGSEARVVADEKQARQTAQARTAARRAADAVTTRRPMSLEDVFKEGPSGELNLIVKADVQGSVEALTDALMKISVGDEIQLNVMHKGVGAVTENDVSLAKASHAIIVGFNVRPSPSARQIAEAEGVDIRHYRVIYEALEEIEQALKGLLAPEYKEAVLGDAEVRQLFRAGRAVFAGCRVMNGEIVRNAQARLIRQGAVVWEGRFGSLKRFTEDVRSVQAGFECGIGLENFMDIHVDDIIEAFEIREIPRA